MVQLLTVSLEAVLLATSLLALSATANPFGTVDKPLTLNQHAEHEKITRVALKCRAGETAASGKCFEPRSLDQIAGGPGTLGGVGSPDSLTPTPEGPEAHCDEADFIDIPGYPNSRAAASAELQKCATHLHGRFKQGIKFAERILDPTTKKIKKSMVDLRDNSDGTRNDCQFAGTTPFPGLGRGKCQAIEGLGRALHGVQDFYSHSNWADHSRDGEAISDVNPPGLNFTSLVGFFDFTSDAPRSVAGIPVNLTTGCFGGLTSDKTPGVDRCAKRVTHHTLNKDHALIDDNGVATLPTHVTAGPSTPRSEFGSNLQLAVSIAVEDTRRQWTLFKENLRTEHGSEDGNTMICAITRDNPLKDCYGRRIALVIDSSGSNTITDPSNLRITAAQQFNAKLITKASAGPDELPDEVTVIDFDTSARIVFPLGDPADATFDGIDSSGGTDIGSGMNVGIDELVRTKPPPSTGDPFTPYEENKAGMIIFTDGEDFSPANQIAQLNRAADLKIRVAYGFLAPPTNPVPVPKRSLQPQKRAIDSSILAAILKTGGLFATIDSAAAQQNFVQMVFKQGITAVNGPAGDAVELLPGLILDRIISSATGEEIFYYMAVAGEHLRLTVKDTNSVSLKVVIINVDSNTVVSEGVTDIPNLVFTFEAGPDTIYRIIVTPPASLGTSVYSIGFASSIPIRNITTTSIAPSTSSTSLISSSTSSIGHNFTTTTGWNSSTSTTSRQSLTTTSRPLTSSLHTHMSSTTKKPATTSYTTIM
ncbi:hypothetical protein BKA65DRAFT_460002 [Rhexocercosporidium sp. MPI-PUGE-AT-0058]|nr:hypothetical protein BKA65DRAFT_460002 [Rhexocercosporidium sp. MPI-PUGE-AT-0058]